MSDENDPTSKLFISIENGDITTLQTLLEEKPNVNMVDSNLMTPLQHAAYKGNKKMVQLLLDYGADPNLCKHQHDYTSLHFAGLSGNVDVCLLLLDAGAKVGVVNAVKRTASQMAAFVGHHKCVAVINNYLEKSQVDYYTRIQGVQSEPYLAPFLADTFHKFIIQASAHPVRVAINLHSFIGLSEHLQQVKTVLELLSERQIKAAECNETLAFKFFYYAYIAGELIKIRSKKSEDQKLDELQVFCKRILKPETDGTLQLMDCLLKECIKDFPYRDSNLFRQMIASLSSQDAPSALSVVNSVICGQRGFTDDNEAICSTCGEEKPTKKCSQCKQVQYCDKNCQKLHWSWHKKVCTK